MTTVPPVGSPSATATGTTPPTSAATLSADFDTFLQMLTAQAKYQDPLEPISSSDYAAQLAQFSMVEQQVFANDQLGYLATLLGGDSISTMAAWVGMEARAVASVGFNGQPVTISPNPAASADRVQLVIYDEEGIEVGRRALPVSAEPFVWDGTDDNGETLPNGTYSFGIESFVEDELVLQEPAEVYARVVEAQLVGGDTVLLLEGGSYVLADRVTALRQPAAVAGA